jgi:cyclic dehypoxanthinyl futalosine synthase
MGSLMIEENVVAEAGTVHHLSLDEIRGAISELGFVPRQRNVHYQLFDEQREQRAIEADRERYQQIRAAAHNRHRPRVESLVPLAIVRGDSTA